MTHAGGVPARSPASASLANPAAHAVALSAEAPQAHQRVVSWSRRAVSRSAMRR